MYFGDHDDHYNCCSKLFYWSLNTQTTFQLFQAICSYRNNRLGQRSDEINKHRATNHRGLDRTRLEGKPTTTATTTTTKSNSSWCCMGASALAAVASPGGAARLSETLPGFVLVPVAVGTVLPHRGTQREQIEEEEEEEEGAGDTRTGGMRRLARHRGKRGHIKFAPMRKVASKAEGKRSRSCGRTGVRWNVTFPRSVCNTDGSQRTGGRTLEETVPE